MTDPNYRKARAALDEADALIAQTEAMLSEAECEAAFAEGEQMLSEIDRAIDTLNRLCDSENFSEKIAAEFPNRAAKSTEELARLQKRQSAVAEKLHDLLLKKQGSYAKYHHAKKIANAAEIILSDQASKLEAEIALLYKEVAIHSAKSDEYEAEAEKFDFGNEEGQKRWNLSFSELDKVAEKLDRVSALVDELSEIKK